MIGDESTKFACTVDYPFAEARGLSPHIGVL